MKKDFFFIKLITNYELNTTFAVSKKIPNFYLNLEILNPYSYDRKK